MLARLCEVDTQNGRQASHGQFESPAKVYQRWITCRIVSPFSARPDSPPMQADVLVIIPIVRAFRDNMDLVSASPKVIVIPQKDIDSNGPKILTWPT
jgi:hypothetical protein